MPLIISILVVLLFPNNAFADGIAPITYVFTKETWLFTSIILAFAIIIEWSLLNRKFKDVGLKINFIRSVIVNISSSIGGSLIYYIYASNQPTVSSYMLDSSSLVIPLFILTILLEIPVLKIFYKEKVSWMRAVGLGLFINVISYLTIMGFFVLWFILAMTFGPRNH